MDECTVKAVLAEPFDPVEKVRAWYVGAVEADSALEVYRLSEALCVEIPSWRALAINSSST